MDSRLADSAGTGEILHAIYHAGSQPGTKRQIVALHIDGDKLHARCVESGIEQTYRIDKLELVCADHPAPAYNPARRNIKPSVQFNGGYARGWAFLVHEAFRPALDILSAEVIDTQRTDELRVQRAREQGVMIDAIAELKSAVPDYVEFRKTHLTPYKIRKLIWTEGTPPAYDFHVGDLLHHRDGVHAIQVNAVDRDGLHVTLYRGDGCGYSAIKTRTITQAGFVDILRNGLERFDNPNDA